MLFPIFLDIKVILDFFSGFLLAKGQGGLQGFPTLIFINSNIASKKARFFFWIRRSTESFFSSIRKSWSVSNVSQWHHIQKSVAFGASKYSGPCYPCYPLLPLVTLFTPCYPCYTCYPLLPLLPFLPLVTLVMSCYPLLPLLPLFTLVFG